MGFKKRNRLDHSGVMRARLSFDEGFRENPIYSIKAKTTEKDKGMEMLELIEQNFSISKKDRDEKFIAKMEEFNQDAMQPTIVPKEIKQEKIKLHRDEKGNLASPFRTKKNG